jgi:hypothetical protein
MVVVAADTDVSGAVVGGMAEEVGAQDLFFLRSASGLSMKFSGKSRPLIHYPVFIHNKEENIENYPLNQGHELLLGLASIIASVCLLGSEVGQLLARGGKLSHLSMSGSELFGQPLT